MIKSHFFNKKPYILSAPLCGYTRLPYRQILSQFQYDLIFTEMVSIDALYYNNKATEMIYASLSSLKNIGVQLVGNKVERFLLAVQKLAAFKTFQVFDVNCGCPVVKVMKTGGGSQLLENPELIYQILSRLNQEFPELTFSAKIRIGITQKTKNYQEVCQAIQESKCSFITVHGRVQEQIYSGNVDFEALKEIKQTLSIPVIGNGGLFTPEDAAQMIQKTQVDGVMLSRGIIGNPWLGQQIRDYFEHRRYQEPSFTEKIKILKQHFYHEMAFEPQKGFRDFKKMILAYLKGINAIKSYKIAFATCHSESEMENLIFQLENDSQLRESNE